MSRATIQFFLILILIPGRQALWAQDAPASTDAEPDTVDTRLVYINDIYIIGNDKTKKSIITRELRVQAGEYVRAADLPLLLEQSENNVYNTNLFYSVAIQKLQQDSAQMDLLVKLTERWYFYPIPVFKLTDRNFNDWWVNRDADLSRVKYGIRMHKYNFRGRNERLKLVALFGFENQFVAGYRIPYIEPSQRHGLNMEVGYTSRNNMAYQTSDHITDFIVSRSQKQEAIAAGVTHTFRNSFYNYFYTTISMFRVNIADTVALLNPNYFGDGATSQQAFKIRHTFSRDLRNNRNYPLSGYLAFASLEKVGIGIFGDVDIWRLEGLYNQNYDLGRGFFFSSTLAGQLTSKYGIPYYNYTSFGFGEYYVRGYELNVIEGYRNILTKNNLRKRIFKHEFDVSRVMPIEQFQKVPFTFYAKIFFDGGWINNYPNYEQSQRLSNRFLYGLGAGLDIVTLYDHVIRLEYSYNAEEETNFFINFQFRL